MTRDPYQGSAYDPASLHRYNYARANPANFIDPTGRIAAGEYGKLSFTDITKTAAGVTALGFIVKCSIYTIASSVQLLGENPGWHLENYSANWRDCWARTTWSEAGRNFVLNGAFLGLGYAVGPALDGIGEWLLGAEEGLATPIGSALPRIYTNSTPLGDQFPELDGINPGYEDGVSGTTTNCVPCTNAFMDRMAGRSRCGRHTWPTSGRS
jgi:hypothetical protein